MTSTTDFPITAQQLTPQWLTAALQANGHMDTGQVSGASCELIGTGKMGDNVRITLDYQGCPTPLPATLVAKLPAADEKARTMAGMQGAYYNEVMFYRLFAPRTSMRTPKIYASELNADNTLFMLLMEDMHPAEPGSQLVGESRERSLVALQQAARLAASFYGDEELGNYDHVMSVDPEDGGAFGQMLLEQQWPEFVDRFGHGLTPELIAFGERYIASHQYFVNRFEGPRTLAHGDFRCENILFNAGSATIVDWQTPCLSSALTDAAYFIGGSLELEQRRLWERELVEAYRVELAGNGVELSFEDCWAQYREFAMHGILITVLGATFSEAAERSDRMFLAMIQRHLQQCVDLDSAEFLG